jgi:hypothetical protein
MMEGNKASGQVRAHSFVVGKAVSNQTSINLLTAESGPQMGEEGKSTELNIFSSHAN